MERFAEVFFVSFIGIIVSLISFFIPLTYRFLRDTAKELAKWIKEDILEKKPKLFFPIQTVFHYYVFIDAITDITAVFGAFSVLSIIVVMSKCLSDRISSCQNIPFFQIITERTVLIALIVLLYLALYFIIWNIAWWDFTRYLRLSYVKKFLYENKRKEFWFSKKAQILSNILWIFLTVFFILLYCCLHKHWEYFDIILPISFMLAILFLIIFIFQKRPKESVTEDGSITNGLKSKFKTSSICLFILALFLFVVGSSLHGILIFGGDIRSTGFGLIGLNIILIISFFLYWFLVGMIFPPNEASIKIYSEINTESSEKLNDKGKESPPNSST